MPKKSMENLTESMLYVLMAFHCRPMCGIEMAAFHGYPDQGAGCRGTGHPVHPPGKV